MKLTTDADETNHAAIEGESIAGKKGAGQKQSERTESESGWDGKLKVCAYDHFTSKRDCSHYFELPILLKDPLYDLDHVEN